MTLNNVVSGFRACGIYPFNPSIFDVQRDSDSEVSDIKRLAYIPLLTPIKKKSSFEDHVSYQMILMMILVMMIIVILIQYMFSQY